MSHLSLEAMARLVDEQPGAAEAAHLEQCATCRAELDAMRDDVHALSLLPDMEPAPDAWDALEERLAAEGLVRKRRLAGAGMQRLSWAAAAVVVFMAGTMAGRMSAPAGVPVAQQPGAPAADAPALAQAPAADPDAPAAAPAATTDAQVVGGVPAGSLAADAPAAQPQPDALPQPRRTSPVTLASTQQRPALPRNMEEAAAVLRQSEELYLAALTRYAELATQAESGDPVARLAALQSIVMTTQAALTQAPSDPVINGYHLTALAQRDATLRQVTATTNDRLY